ncbi:7484_t:CDS:1 [Acaulospora morrowiae]|uniref:7484_t:CDS:1 n=1 Tax=Acaulospora morrowiae TaxID=94023 RepID=A0A9N9DYW5_9GLOM|nr:7484_t:CDS:1 [Acaulospora morrowiae]
MRIFEGVQKGPTRESYRHYSEKIYFSYLQNHNQFQNGYLGLQPSRVVGSFHLRYPHDHPLKAERIDLYFKGKSSVRWRNGDNEITSHKKFCKLSKTVWSSCVPGTYENLVSLDIPFEFNLPDHIPASVLTLTPFDSGDITYSIKAKVRRSSNYLHFQGHTKIIECWLDINRWTLPPTPDYSPKPLCYETSTFKCLVSLDQSKFGTTDVIHVPIKLTLIDMRAFVKRIVVILKEYNRLKAKFQRKLIKGRVIVDAVEGDKVLSLNDDNDFMVTMKLDLSQKKIHCTCETDLIDIWYKIKVKVYMGNAGVSCKTLEKDVEIYDVLNDVALMENADVDTSWITEPSDEIEIAT